MPVGSSILNKNLMKLVVQGAEPATSLTLDLPGGRGGDRAVMATLAAMGEVVKDAARPGTPLAAVARSPAVMQYGVYDWLRLNFAFEPDPPKREWLQHPAALLTPNPSPSAKAPLRGDCDDRAMFGAAMLIARGQPACLIVMGRRAEGRYEHVYFGLDRRPRRCAAQWKGAPLSPPANIVPLDPQENTPLGEWTQPMQRLLIYPIV